MKHRNIFFQLVFATVVTSLSIFYGCKEPNQETGTIKLNLLNSSLETDLMEDDRVSAFIISVGIEGVSDTILYRERIEIHKIGSSITSDPILLNAGKYELLEFYVVDSDDNVLYATPKQGSVFENFVNSALPISINIGADEILNIVIEVMNTESLDPDNLGYTSLTFRIVETVDILVSVFAKNHTNETLELIESEVSVFADQKFIYSTTLDKGVETLKLPSSSLTYDLKFSAFGLTKTQMLTNEDLQDYIHTPLEVIFEDMPELPLPFARYTLDGHLNDLSGNELHGELYDATHTFDRFENQESAIQFNGESSYGEFPVDFDFESRTVNLWVNVASWINPGFSQNNGNTIFNSDHSGLQNGATILSVSNNDNELSLFFNMGAHLDVFHWEPIDADTWYMVTITTTSDQTKYYLDGELVGTYPRYKISSQDGRSVAGIGNSRRYDRHFHGALDDISIFNRALSDSEVGRLYNQ